MKEIKQYISPKYKDTSKYKEIREGVYQTKIDNKKYYVTSLSFEQEPEYDEGVMADKISQYPLEDILDNYHCHISDFYEDLNTENSKTCYQEFASSHIESMDAVQKLIDRHVYLKSEEGVTYIMIDENYMYPIAVKQPIRLIRKNPTPKELVMDICGIVIVLGMLAVLISAFVAGFTKSSASIFIFAISWGFVIISVSIIHVLKNKK